MPIWCCTECGCEAVASNVDMVLSMGWLVEPTESEGEQIGALCAKCRVYRKGPARSAGVERGTTGRDASSQRADARQPRGPRG